MTTSGDGAASASGTGPSAGFEKLDLEVYEDSICSSAKFAPGEADPILEVDVSSEIHESSQGKDSTMDAGGLYEEDQLSDWESILFDKFRPEANEGCICCTGKVAQLEKQTLVEGGISSEIYRSSGDKDSTTAKVGFRRLIEDDGYADWLIKMSKMGGDGDIISHYNLDKVEKHPVHYGVPDEISDLNSVSKKEIIQNGIKWMSEECFLAFTKYAKTIDFEGIERKFGELHYRCLSVEAYDKTFHHYNFTIEAKDKSSNVSTSELYFAEVKQISGVKSYFCCLLKLSDEGHCYGCKNQDMCDLKHPIGGGYEEGNADIFWPFIDDSDSDSDDVCGGHEF